MKLPAATSRRCPGVRGLPGLPRFVVLPRFRSTGWPSRRQYKKRGVAGDIDPKAGKLRLRSRVVMNVGALTVGALMVGGAVRAPLGIAAACLRKWGSSRERGAPADRLSAKKIGCGHLQDIPDDGRRTPTT